jgi:hypothetical protein
MLIEYDQTTMANMTAALDSVCKKIPRGHDSHDTRKLIADAMLASARSGRRNFIDFRSAGMAVLDGLGRSKRFSLFGMLRRAHD